LNKRSSASGLKDVELELVKRHGISIQEIEGDFKLNVEGLTPRKLQEVADAIEKVRGLPKDFITFDASKARTITTEASISEVFKLNDKETIRALLPVVGTLVIKAQTSAKIEEVIKATSKMLGVK
jgi:hypothetical protein